MSTKKIATIATVFVALVLADSASAATGPVLDIQSSHVPAGAPVPAGTYARYTLVVSNTGDQETTEPVTVEFNVPAGLEVTEVTPEKAFELPLWDCSTPDAQTASCSGPEIPGFGPLPIEPGSEACKEAFFGFVPRCRIEVTVRADQDAAPGIVHPTIEACGGGDTSCASADDPLEIVPFDFQIRGFDGSVLQENGDPATQAGSHPHTASTSFSFSTAISGDGLEYPTAQLKDTTVELPPGLVGNPLASPTCTQAQLQSHYGTGATNCPPDSQVGVVTVHFGGVGFGDTTTGVYDMERPQGSTATPIGTPGLFGFDVYGTRVEVYAKLRTGGDYGVTVITKDAPQTLTIKGVDFTFWGVPADPAHTPERFCPGENPQGFRQGPSGLEPCSSGAPLKPFLSLPTSCVGTGPNNSVETFLDVSAWEGETDSASFLSHDNTLPTPNPIGADGCNAVDFSPTLQARPTTNVADAPSGLDVDLHIPQREGCDPGPPVSCEAAEAHLRDTTVVLPRGMAINPSGANGLGTCSEAQFGFTGREGDTLHTTAGPATCPDAAKLGTVEVDTPLVDHPLEGAVYIAAPHANPFDSLLAIYITVDDKQTGTVVKLAGEVHADPVTGRLTTTVMNNPQLPFEDFKLEFFGGAGGSLRTPPTCGAYATTSALTPWTAPEGETEEPSDPWSITQAPGGGACPSSDAARPNAPALDAGTIAPIAGAYSPMVVNLRRQDGSQEFSTVTVSPPPGLVGKLAGIPYCPESALQAAAGKTGTEEEASPSCPAASRLGPVAVAAGAGPAPYWAHGTAYLTGPYKGAPIGLAIVTPATAGPFDLGTVVTRVALSVDSKTAQITAKADPLPSILQGIPLDVRQALIKLDRPGFSLNPTSCDPTAFSGSLVSTLGQTAALSNRYQLAECSSLGLKPKISLSLTGGTGRRGHPGLTATLEPRAGDANLASVSVALPSDEILDQAHIGTVCTRPDFAAENCPAGSEYGTARVSTPLLDYELSGPVYLRSNPEHTLPDLVPDLRGPASQPIRLESAGRTDTFHGGLRNSFEMVPDAPFTKLVLTLPGGNRGLIQNTKPLCSKKQVATVKYVAHNGFELRAHPAIKLACPKQSKKHRKHHHRRTHRHGRRLAAS
jgi:hypothetical protein